ncbi:alpha-L-fucosidase [Planctomonas psychrotolerans]|uniref:alpha-L-fucosidase n=1 Tax=Planctomonas psychrotolerans TaxID=2528712 RepID=UPI0012395BBE|nr:alpha-L-fucosidase [Planctomonas psychrotolerans]
MMDRLPPLDASSLPDRVDVSDNTAALARVRAVIDDGPFSDDWDSLQSYEPPRWYEDAKFGIFLHWGVYSVPAFNNEWYSRNMYLEGSPEFDHHVATHGSQSEFGYKDFIPSFTMDRFDADEWAALFRRAGAQFVVPVAEHHDGFAMYDTQRSRWSAARMGPRRDVFGELSAATDRAWMVRGASSHRAEHWFFMNGGARFASDVLDPEFVDFYGPAQREETAPNERFLEDWLLRTVEIIDTYRPQVLWFDWWIEQPAFAPYVLQLAAYYYNRAQQWGRGVVINYKWDAFADGSAVYDVERGTLGGIRPTVWQNDTSVSKTAWCWVDNHDYKTVDELIAELADVVSKNGVLLLNVGPRPDGTIPAAEQAILEGIGHWLTTNGESIYGTRPWLIASEGPTEIAVGSFVDGDAPAYTAADFRFTSRADVTGDYVYAIPLAAPTEPSVTIRAFGRGSGLLHRKIKDVTILGAAGPVPWTQTSEALHVDPPTVPAGNPSPVVRVLLEPESTPPRTDFLHG